MIEKNKKVKIVIITSGGMNGRRLANLFSLNNISYELITVSFPLPKNNNWLNINFVKKYVRGILSNIKLLRDFKMRGLVPYPIKEKFVGRLNEDKMHNVLNKIKPDYIFMMGGGILKDSIIKTAKFGVLNAHPGILPYIRGVDAIRHAILKDIPIGVTGHFIDAGIDTGAIIERFDLPIDAAMTLDDVINKSNELSVAVMFKFASEIIDGNSLVKTSQNDKYALCKKLGSERIIEANEKFIRDWYKTQNTKLVQMSDLSSGEELLKYYENCWAGKEKF